MGELERDKEVELDKELGEDWGGEEWKEEELKES